MKHQGVWSLTLAMGPAGITSQGRGAACLLDKQVFLKRIKDEGRHHMLNEQWSMYLSFFGEGSPIAILPQHFQPLFPPPATQQIGLEMAIVQPVSGLKSPGK